MPSAPCGQLPFLRAHVGPGTSLQADGPLTTLALQPRSSSVPHQAGHVLRRSNIAFSRITQNWRGNPLISLEVIVSLIAATRTYPKGVKVSGKETAQLNLH